MIKNQVDESTPLTISAFLKKMAKQIEQAESLTFQSPSLESRILFEHVCKVNHAWLLAHGDDLLDTVVSAEQLNEIFECVKARLQGKPIAFIVGTQDFWNLRLNVSECTLIPRQDSEILVETALDLKLKTTAKVLDLGTGTGAIALALAKEQPRWDVTGVDKIEQAVSLAKQNAALNNIDMMFLQSDWFEVFNNNENTQLFDLIVSNPPYVEANSPYLQQGDLRFEPLTALASGDDGLDDIRHIVKQSVKYLSQNGYLIIEHGSKQAEQVQILYKENGFTNIKTMHDLNNLPRITLGSLL